MTKPQLAALVASSEPGHEGTNVQQGAGQKHSKYQSFVASHMKQNGGNMAAAAKAYKLQTGSGHCGCDQKAKGRQIQTGNGFWHNLVHDAGKDIDSDVSGVEAVGDDVVSHYWPRDQNLGVSVVPYLGRQQLRGLSM